MNFVGHIHIAGHCLDRFRRPSTVSAVESPVPAATETRDRYLFGTALPDFAAIGRFLMQGEPANPTVAVGVDMHHSTDSAFHGCQWFRTHSQEVTTALEQRGINRGAAMACGHVGVELLLDGHLLAENVELRPVAQRVLELADQADLGVEELVPADRQADWTAHLRRISTWPLPDDYHNPMAVAERLYRILRPRDRLAFDQSQIALVADALDQASTDLIAGVPDMVDGVSREVLTDLR